jgi:hypothetical protein
VALSRISMAMPTALLAIPSTSPSFHYMNNLRALFPTLANITINLLGYGETCVLCVFGEVACIIGRFHAMQSCGDTSSPNTSFQMHSRVLLINAKNPSVAVTNVKSTCDLTTKSRGVTFDAKWHGLHYFGCLRSSASLFDQT